MLLYRRLLETRCDPDWSPEGSPLSVTEDYDYNPDGTLATKTDGELNTTTYSYDAFKRLTSTTHVGQITTSMTYDSQGNNLTVTDPENNATQYQYRVVAVSQGFKQVNRTGIILEVEMGVWFGLLINLELIHF